MDEVSADEDDHVSEEEEEYVDEGNTSNSDSFSDDDLDSDLENIPLVRRLPNTQQENSTGGSEGRPASISREKNNYLAVCVYLKDTQVRNIEILND